MKTTMDLVLGEAHFIMRHLVRTQTNKYNKNFYDEKFFRTLHKTLKGKLPNHKIKTWDDDEYYVMRIDEDDQ